MVLDFDTYTSLFDNSQIRGYGLGSNNAQTVIGESEYAGAEEGVEQYFRNATIIADTGLSGADRLVDQDTGTYWGADTPGQLCIFQLAFPVKLTQLRHFGQATQVNGDGLWTISYWSLEDLAWKTWTTFATRDVTTWSDWLALKEIRTTKIRITATTIDTGLNGSLIGEFEVKY